MKKIRTRKKLFLKRDDRGISPIIASILLVAMVLIIAIIIFLWLRGLTKEAIVKFDKNIELVCNDVQFSASYSNGNLQLANNGNVPIWDMRLKLSSSFTKSSSTEDISNIDDIPINGLLQAGQTKKVDISSSISDIDKIIVIPILRGSTESGEKTYVCDDRFGKEIIIE